MDHLSVRPIHEADFEQIVDYFLKADKAFLVGMGVDIAKLPTRDAWLELLQKEYQHPIEQKSFFYLIWLLNDTPVGHSNINKIRFGEEAYMHLHSWNPPNRKKGMGLQFIKMCLPYYFDLFQLKKLYCEPYALNPAPNKTLQKIGFILLESYETTPGWINFHQPVNRWCLNVAQYQRLFS